LQFLADDSGNAQLVWDRELARMGGSLLQSWRWGEYRRRQGWRIERLRVENGSGVALAQVMFKHAGPISFAHIPRGPVVSGDAIWPDLVEAIDQTCRRHRAVSVVVECEQEPVFVAGQRQTGFAAGPPHLHPARTIKASLGSDDELLAAMHASTRYHVRRAARDGVAIERAAGDASDRALFYRLLADTCRRNGFPIHPPAYYDDLLRLFDDDAALMMARHDDQIIAAALAVCFGDGAVYLHGGTSTERRGHGAAHLLQWELMRWARERGSHWYDFWGIATDGLYQFKIGFGGEVIDYPPTLERRYHPALAGAARVALAARDPIRTRIAQRSLKRRAD